MALDKKKAKPPDFRRSQQKVAYPAQGIFREMPPAPTGPTVMLAYKYKYGELKSTQSQCTQLLKVVKANWARLHLFAAKIGADH